MSRLHVIKVDTIEDQTIGRRIYPLKPNVEGNPRSGRCDFMFNLGGPDKNSEFPTYRSLVKDLRPSIKKVTLVE